MNKRMFKYRCFAFLFAVSLIIAPAISYAGDTARTIKLNELNTLLESNKGKVVILDLWATWCPPCRKEIPGFISLYKKYKDKGLEIIGVSFDENGPEVVPPFMKAMGINYPIYLGGGDIARKYELHAYPTTIVYGKDGKAASKHVGYASEEEFEDELRELLKK
ncbi:MAG: TlpA family protein disulfide reductase [Candidatus Brocadiaceae bacterium]|nr:TlpA family protein disulfide reductase [Candidatus Brocadiaceae bacterium]